MSEADYMKALLQRAEELIRGESEPKEKAPTEAIPKPKIKRFISDEKKEELKDRLKLAREKSKAVRAMKKDIKDVVKKEEVEETNKKFSQKPIEEKIEQLKIAKESKVEETPKAVEAPKIVEAPKVIETPKVETPVAPVKQSPKYFLPSMSFARKHFINPL